MAKDTKDKNQRTILKADRNVLQHINTAYEAGRPVDLQAVLKHELLPAPVSLKTLSVPKLLNFPYHEWTGTGGCSGQACKRKDFWRFG